VFNFQKEPGAGGDQVGSPARRLSETQHALAEQERIEEHGAGICISGRKGRASDKASPRPLAARRPPSQRPPLPTDQCAPCRTASSIAMPCVLARSEYGLTIPRSLSTADSPLASACRSIAVTRPSRQLSSIASEAHDGS